LRPRLLIATHNAGKVREIAALLAATPWTCAGLPEGTPDFPEDGETFGENARGKALFYADHVGMAALADDSGLIIDALHGEPGVYSARYIDPDLTQEVRNARVLERLATVADAARTARFTCHLALALPGHVVHEVTGSCEGAISRAPHGEGGFGYDPIFRPAGHAETFAEISPEAKAKLSHRGKAVRGMIDFLHSWDPEGGVS
jgi:XTP/dITP diphosphohydrolase